MTTQVIENPETAATLVQDIVTKNKMLGQEIDQLKRTIEQYRKELEASDNALKKYAEYGLEELLEEFDGSEYILVRLTDKNVYLRLLARTIKLLGNSGDLNVRKVVEMCLMHCLQSTTWASLTRRYFNNAIEARTNTNLGD